MRSAIVLAVVGVAAASGAQAQAGLAAPLPAVGLNAATAPPLVCPDGAHVEGGRPPAATTEVCKRPDGKKEGGFRQWADDGSLKLAGQYRDDAADGPWQGWHPNGERQFVGAYAAGKWSGVWNYWGPDGQRKADVTYRDGRDVSAEVAAEGVSRSAEATAAGVAADVEKRRADADAAWRRAKTRTPAVLDDIIDTYGEDALSPELVTQREAFNARIGERDSTMTYDDDRTLWLFLSTNPATISDMVQKGYDASPKAYAAGLAARGVCAYVTDLPARPIYKSVVEISDAQAVVVTGTRARFAQLCKSSTATADKMARSMASVVTLTALPLRVELADPDLSSRPLREVQELAACVTSRRPVSLTETQWLMIAPVRVWADIDPRTGGQRPYLRVFTQAITTSTTTDGDMVLVSVVSLGVLVDGTLNVLDERTTSRAYPECEDAACTRIHLKLLGRDVGSFTLATTPLRSWPVADGPDAALKRPVCTTILTANDARYIPVDTFRALAADMVP
jgi:hypothetical protein